MSEESSVFNWVLEPSLKLTIGPISELEEQLYYTPPEHYTESIKDVRKIERPSTIRQVLRGYISSLISMLSKSAYNIEIYDDNLYGTVVRITTDLSAKDALELWLKLIYYLPYENYRVVLSVKWLGENNVSEDELINYIVEIMIKSKIGPKALPGFDTTRIVQEARE